MSPNIAPTPTRFFVPSHPFLQVFVFITDLVTDQMGSAKLYEIGAGTSEVRRMVIGRAFNKEYANYSL